MDISIIPPWEGPQSLWSWGSTEYWNADDVLPTLPAELRNLMMEVMKQCLEEYGNSYCGNCKDIEKLPGQNEGFFCCGVDGPEPFTCECGEQAIEFETQYGHVWGPENIKIVSIYRTHDFEPDDYGNDLFVEVMYTYGHHTHTWAAGYGVNSETGEASCYVS